MRENIVILNVLKFEKEGKEKTRLSFVFSDKEKMSIGSRMKGYADLSLFYDGTMPFDNIPNEALLDVVEANLVERPSKSNPLRKSTIIDKITYKGKTYELC